MPRVVVLDDYQGRAHEFADWSALGADVEFVRDHLGEEDLVAVLAGAEIAVAMRERTAFSRRVLEQLPDLRLLVTTGMSNASIDVAAALERGVVVCGTRSNASNTTELTWALILAAVKRVVAEDAALRAGRWQSSICGDLSGKTLGLIGLGRLGAAMLPVANAFRMRVVAWSQNLTEARTTELGVELVSFETLLAESDVASIHLRLSERTRSLIGAAELAQMRPSAILVNTSRGPIIDERALVDALRARIIGGAALDVYDEEPLPPDHPLLALDNTVLAPHLGYVSEDNFAVHYGEAVEDIAAFLSGSPLRALEV